MTRYNQWKWLENEANAYAIGICSEEPIPEELKFKVLELVAHAYANGYMAGRNED